MAYKLAVGNIIDFPVHIKLRDGDRIKDYRFSLQATRIDADHARDLFNQGTSAAQQTIDEFLQQHLTGWRDQRLVLDADTAEPAPFSAEALAALLTAPGAGLAIYQTYMQAVVASNGAEAVRKN